MKLALFNGSPRHKKSNSEILIKHFMSGFNSIVSTEIPLYFLANGKEQRKQIEAFQNSEIVIFIFPLYTDCMPGIVKEFFEQIYELKDKTPKKIGFIVQSGFPESIHSVYIERYLKKFTERQNFHYLGTVIKGGVEGIRIMPDWMTKRLFKQFQELGKHFAQKEEFSPKIQKALRQPYRMSATRLFVFRILQKTGIANFYWDSQLKKNGAIERSFEQPFV